MVTQNNGNSHYAHTEALVSTNWVAAHLNNSRVQLVEVSVDTAAYVSSHIAGAIGWSWQEDTQDALRRDMPSQAAYPALMPGAGTANDSNVL